MLIDEFVAPGNGGLERPSSIIFGPDDNLYVSAETNFILRYDGQTGAFTDEFVTPGTAGVFRPGGIAFGVDGHLYVANHFGDSILRFEGGTGAFIDEFVTSGSGGLDRPYGLAFVPAGPSIPTISTWRSFRNPAIESSQAGAVGGPSSGDREPTSTGQDGGGIIAHGP